MYRGVFRVMFLSLFLAGVACSNESFERTESGISFQKGELTYRIDVLADHLVRVIKHSGNDYSPRLDQLIVVMEAGKVKWDAREVDGIIRLRTDSVLVLVDESGVVSFLDSHGKALLQELEGGTRFSEDSLQNSVYQAFGVGKEALYGLGQFQSGMMNWKHTPVQLRQYNQEIAIPFLVSTMDYGLLWNNNSITEFNHPENEIVFDKVLDETLNVREATFTAPSSGEYFFYVESPNPEKNRRDGPVLLTIDDDTVIHFNTVWVPDCHTGKMDLEAGNSYTIILRNSQAQTDGRLFVNGPAFGKTTFASKKGQAVDYYFVYGQNPAEVMHGYRELTGKAPLFPKWAYGFWQCRERYHNQAELLENAREYRRRKIPLDNIVQDWHYWNDGTKGPSWNPLTYPDPRAMCEELASLNLNLMVSVWPEVKDEEMLTRYGLEQHKLIHQRSSRDIYNLDFFHPEVADGYAAMLRDSMYDIGVKAIWLDGTEPQDPPHDWTSTFSGRWDEVTNAYSLVVNKAVYEGKMKDFPNQRVFNLTRSAFTGQQRYSAASWSGDVAATWEQFAEQIPAGLNFCMAGIPYWTTDIGGFFRDSKSLNPVFKDQYNNPEFIELLTRWFQYGTFTPVFRIHGYVSQTEIWRYGAAFEKTARNFIDLRYQLMPYIYSEAWKVTKQDEIMMKPLAYAYPEDQKTWGIKDQFLFGDQMMICPVTSYKAREREVYLPAGGWFDFWTGEYIEGGSIMNAEAPLNLLPLYVKAGSIFPFGPKVQYASEKVDAPLEIRIYGGADASYTLYEDDHLSNDYLNEKFSEIKFHFDHHSSVLTIFKGEGSYVDYSKEPLSMVVVLMGASGREQVRFKGEKMTLQI